MKRPISIIIVSIAALAWAAPASALSTIFVEVPASASAGEEIPITVKARVTDSINAIAATILLAPESVRVLRFDDTRSAVRLWLERGTPVEGGVRLQGVIPGGIGPAFTDVIELGTVWITTDTQETIRVSFADTEVYLHQPTPTADTVQTQPLSIRLGPAAGSERRGTVEPIVTDSDVRIVREPELHGGRRSLVFDIKTDQGTVDLVRVRERWLGIAGTWREAGNATALSDAWGVSVVDVALPDPLGGASVATIIPTPLIVLWVLGGLIIGALVVRRRLRRR